jgi:hypothetical protein
MPGKPTDMRQYRRRTERTMVIAIVVMFVVVGSVAIGLTYGWRSVLTGLACLVPGAVVFILLWLFWAGVERLTKDDDD